MLTVNSLVPMCAIHMQLTESYLLSIFSWLIYGVIETVTILASSHYRFAFNLLLVCF